MQNKMKIILLMIIFSTINTISFSNFSNNNEKQNLFIGHWVSEGGTIRIVIFKDKDNHFQMIWTGCYEEDREVTKIEFIGDSMKTSEKLKGTHFIIRNTYTLENANLLKIIGGDGSVAPLKRIK